MMSLFKIKRFGLLVMAVVFFSSSSLFANLTPAEKARYNAICQLIKDGLDNDRKNNNHEFEQGEEKNKLYAERMGLVRKRDNGVAHENADEIKENVLLKTYQIKKAKSLFGARDTRDIHMLLTGADVFTGAFGGVAYAQDQKNLGASVLAVGSVLNGMRSATDSNIPASERLILGALNVARTLSYFDFMKIGNPQEQQPSLGLSFIGIAAHAISAFADAYAVQVNKDLENGSCKNIEKAKINWATARSTAAVARSVADSCYQGRINVYSAASALAEAFFVMKNVKEKVISRDFCGLCKEQQVKDFEHKADADPSCFTLACGHSYCNNCVVEHIVTGKFKKCWCSRDVSEEDITKMKTELKDFIVHN